MAQYDIKTNSRIEELTEEEQLIIVRLVNHLASFPDTSYQDFAFKRLEEITRENPWCDDIAGFDREAWLEEFPIGEDEA
jgi:hypothetical protein